MGGINFGAGWGTFLDHLPAGADLRGKEGHFAAVSTGTYVLATDQVNAIGVICNGGATGELTSVKGFGEALVVSAAAITRGAFVNVNVADGRAKTAVGTEAPIARAMQSVAGANQLCRIVFTRNVDEVI